MARISKFMIALPMVLSHIAFSASSQPPRALFGFGTTYNDTNQKYGLNCSNASILKDEGVASIEYKNSKADKSFASSTTTPHGEEVIVTCDTNKHYYETATSKDNFTTKCNSGTWQNNSVCVRKCKFTKSEFKVDSIVKGKDTSQQSSAQQFVIVDFTTATSPSKYGTIQTIGSSYFVPVGDSVEITCPSTHPPFTSDSTQSQFINLDKNSFLTTCMPTTGNANKWSNYAACYNGYKPCNNSEITVKVEGQDIYTDDGEVFKEFGGEKVSPDGKTLHGAKLALACNKYPWYKKYDYTAPTCRDGKWTSTNAYCQAYSCTVKEIFEGAEGITGGKASDSLNSIADDRNKKLYYNQTHIFRCKYANRVGGTEGKAFKCVFNANDGTEIKEQKQYASNWYNRYCTTKCGVNIGGFYSYFGTGETFTNTIAEAERYVVDQYDRWAWQGCPGGYETDCHDITCSHRTCTKYGYRTTQYEQDEYHNGCFWKSCDGGYDEIHDIGVVGCWHCRKRWIRCNYKSTDHSCNSSGSVSTYDSWENVYFYDGWSRSCIESGITESDLSDQSYKSANKTSKQRIQCTADGGCAVVNVQ